jgi:hypothetical protein
MHGARPSAANGSCVAPPLPRMMWPPPVLAQPRPRGAAAAADQLSPRWLPPPSAAWSTAAPAAMPTPPHIPHMPPQWQQTVPPHLLHTAHPASSAGVQLTTTLPDMHTYHAGPPGSTGYRRPPGLTLLQSGGAANVAPPAAAMQQARLPLSYCQPAQAAQRVPQQSMQQLSAQQGASQPRPMALNPAQLSTAPRVSVGLRQTGMAAPRPQQRSKVLKPSQQPVTFPAGLQHWQQLQPGAGSAVPPQRPQKSHARMPSSAGYLQPRVRSDQRAQQASGTGTLPTPLPAKHAPSADLGSTAQLPPDAGIQPAALANGAPVLHHLQVPVSLSPRDCLAILQASAVGFPLPPKCLSWSSQS